MFAIAEDSSVKIQGTAPANNGGFAITSFTATVVGKPTLTASAAAFPLTVTGLTNGQSYQFSVYATNSKGNSATVLTGIVVPCELFVCCWRLLTHVLLQSPSPLLLLPSRRPSAALTTSWSPSLVIQPS